MNALPQVERDARHRVRRHPERASYDPAELREVLDAGWLAHVGFVVHGQPFVIPMLYARDGSRVILHGSVSSRLLGTLSAGVACCVEVTHVDGLVLARSHFSHSVNYRSAVVFGRARLVEDAADKARCLRLLVEAIVPGRGDDARAPDAGELAGTLVLAVEIEDASVKARAGGPKDHVADLTLPVWAGVVPLRTVTGTPEPADDMPPGTPLPTYLVAPT